MTGRKLLFAAPLLLLVLTPVCALAANVKAQSSTRYPWYAAELLYDSLDELDDGCLNGSVAFSGKAAFRR